MRVLLLGQVPADVVTRLAECLRVPHVAAAAGARASELDLPTSGFVLERFPRTDDEARELDRLLDARAAGLDAVVNMGGDDALLAHYRGRIVEADGSGSAEDVFDRILGGLREALIAA